MKMFMCCIAICGIVGLVFNERLIAALDGVGIVWQFQKNEALKKEHPEKTSYAKLRSRSSFKSIDEFTRSKSFKSSTLAFEILPIALVCKDLVALAAAKSVIATVAEKPIYPVMLMINLDMKKHPKKYTFSKRDCESKLPKLMKKLRRQI